ncbi:hypothetical protein [Methanocrinis sp.]|uniref:hypothetical protein n=1 Tax=Methanocrinis sp. TaxID=3101522 RepID=UPI003D0A4836
MKETCWKDTAKYSYRPRRKRWPPLYRLDRGTFDHSITTLKEAVEGAKLERRERYDAIRWLKRYAGGDSG